MRSKPILVVDDEPAILEMLADLLGYEGYTVFTTSEGSTAVARAKEDPPSVILLDLMMPGMSGWQVIAALHATPQTRSIPIILLSARRDLSATAEELGITTYLAKPFDLDELLDVVAMYAGVPRSPSANDSPTGNHGPR